MWRLLGAWLLVLPGSMQAQQLNQPGVATMLINGATAQTVPIVGVSAPRGSTQTVEIGGPSNAPFITVMCPGLLVNGMPLLGFAGDLLDLDLTGGFGILFDGTANPLAVTDGMGQFRSQFAIDSMTPLGLRAAAQTVVADPSTSIGRLSAASEVVVTPGTITTVYPSVTANFPVTFDLSAQGLSFPFYGNTYTSLEIHDDGFISLNPTPVDWTPTPAEMLAGVPRIAAMWTGLDVQWNPGSITVEVDPTAAATPFTTIRIRWQSMATQPIRVLSIHSFDMTLVPQTGDIFIDHDAFSGPPAFSVLVGISPGNNLSPAGITAASDLSAFAAAPRVGLPNEALYEWFGNPGMTYWTNPFSNPLDLNGSRVSFLGINAGTTGASYYGN